jgi:hypothetical protein
LQFRSIYEKYLKVKSSPDYPAPSNNRLLRGGSMNMDSAGAADMAGYCASASRELTAP